MKKAALVGLLAVLWLVLKLALRVFGANQLIGNATVDLILLLLLVAAAIAVGVWLMRIESH